MKFLPIILLAIALMGSCAITKSSTNSKFNASDCVRENWLTIHKGSDQVLFRASSEQLDVYEEIKQLLLAGEIRLWTERKNNPEWLTSPLPESVHDSIQNFYDSLYYNIYFDYLSTGNSPLKTVSGKDSIATAEEGYQFFLYPLPKYEPVTFDKITEIRIKEILVYDSLQKKEYLKPSLIAFDVYADGHNILFWVKVDDLDRVITLNRKWIEHIVDKKYSGFVYKRYSCNDPDYEWKKVYY